MRHYYSPFLVVVFHIPQIAFGIFLDKNRLLKCNGLIKGLFKHILLKEEVKWNNAPYYFLELITRTMIHYETILLPTNIILDNHLLFIRYRSLPFQIYQDDIWLTLKRSPYRISFYYFHYLPSAFSEIVLISIFSWWSTSSIQQLWNKVSPPLIWIWTKIHSMWRTVRLNEG